MGFLLQMLKTNCFDRDGYRTFIVQIPCRNKKTFLFARIISEKIVSNEYFQVINAVFVSGDKYWTSLIVSSVKYCICLPSLNPHADNLSQLLQSLDRQSYLCNFSSFSFYFSEDKFQVHDYQLLLFIYVIIIQLQIKILYSFFIN